jgi:dUTP pyrophosphatase
MKIQIKKLHPDAVVPQYQTKGASGFDLVALEDITICPGETKIVKTGIAIAVPEGFELQVRPRSGLSLKTPLRVANSPGTVDSDYRGECCVIMTNSSIETNCMTDISGNLIKAMAGTQYIKKGDRIAQGVVCPVVQAEIELVAELDSTDRGAKGFGSTGG